MNNASSVELRLKALETQQAALVLADNMAWMLLCGALIILMQVGFAMLESGMVRENNIVTTFAKNVFDFLVGSLVAVAWGFPLTYGEYPTVLFRTNANGDNDDHFFFRIVYQATCATIVSGAIAQAHKRVAGE